MQSTLKKVPYQEQLDVLSHNLRVWINNDGKCKVVHFCIIPITHEVLDLLHEI